MEMKPFDLERARAGDPITLCNGTPAHFIGSTTDGFPVVEVHGLVRTLFATDLLMATKVTTYYVNIYKSVIDNKPAIGNILHASEKDARQTRNHDDTYIKTISFEVEE
jgi:hypothetical protein